jgi:hypothetical protein
MSAFGGGPGDERSGDELPEQPELAVLIEIPDDARELAHEAAAYRREVRAARRRATIERVFLLERWRRYGLTGPLVVGVIAIVIAVTALFLALRPDRSGGPHQEPLATQASAPVGAIGGLIPDANLVVGSTQSARSLRPAVLALVPTTCNCQQVVDNLAREAGQFGLTLYVVAPTSTNADVETMTSAVHGGQAVPAFDPAGALAQTYAAHGVTAVLLRSDGVVTGVVRDLTPSSPRLGTRLATLDRLTG